MLDQKLKGVNHQQQENEKASLLLPETLPELRILIEREARRLAGYRQGREISDQFLGLLQNGDANTVSGNIEQWLQSANDPRLNEIVHRLQSLLATGGR